MDKHTKGPWRVEEGTTVVWGACDPDDKSTFGMGYPIADVRTMFGHIPSLRSHREDEAEANACLIAAAPDLLSVMKIAIDHIALMYSGIAGGNAEAGQNFADKDPVVKAMRDVIDKAEGR